MEVETDRFKSYVKNLTVVLPEYLHSSLSVFSNQVIAALNNLKLGRERYNLIFNLDRESVLNASGREIVYGLRESELREISSKDSKLKDPLNSTSKTWALHYKLHRKEILKETKAKLVHSKHVLETVLASDLSNLYKPLLERYDQLSFKDREREITIEGLERKRDSLLKEREELRSKPKLRDNPL